jgi:hypothetical protein
MATRGFGGAVKGLREPGERLVATREPVSAAQRPRDLLDLLVAIRREDGSLLSQEEIADETLTFLLAGHETTANALSWTLALLSAYPASRERLEEELATVLGSHRVRSMIHGCGSREGSPCCVVPVWVICRAGGGIVAGRSSLCVNPGSMGPVLTHDDAGWRMTARQRRIYPACPGARVHAPGQSSPEKSRTHDSWTGLSMAANASSTACLRHQESLGIGQNVCGTACA